MFKSNRSIEKLVIIMLTYTHFFGSTVGYVCAGVGGCVGDWVGDGD